MNLDKKWLAVAATLLLLGGAVLVFSGDDDTPDDTTATTPGSGPTAPTTLPAGTGASATAATPGGGLEDTARMFDLGVAGHLTLDVDTKAALDLTLAQLGANPSADDIRRVEDSLRKGLPAAAAQQAIALLHNYRAYSTAYARENEKAEPPTTLAELKAQIDKQEALTRRHFDPATAKALFGPQIAHSRFMLEAQAIEADMNLSPIERAQRIKALRDRMPAEVVALEGMSSPAERELEQQVVALRQRGGSETEVSRLRTQVIGTEGAQALAQQEQQRAQFEGRLRAYLDEKKTLGAPTQAQLDALLAKHFPPEEVAAARAYDRLQTR